MSQSSETRYLLLKIDPRPRRRSVRLTDHLVKAGFQVLDVATTTEASRMTERVVPTIVVVFDEVRRGVDAMEWLWHQQNAPSAQLAMTPLIILADVSRRRQLRHHELSDRVRVVSDDMTFDELTNFIRDILAVWLL